MGSRERRNRSDESDRYLAKLFHDAIDSLLLTPTGLALTAVGGFGRGELSPGSDLDILILHQGQLRPAELAEFVNKLLYPLWDRNRVDHSVRTRAETSQAGASDLIVALGLLDLRFIAGDAELAAAVQRDALDSWRKNARKRLPELRAALIARHQRAGELAYLLEPDLKQARGGLRDVNALRAIVLSDLVELPLARIGEAESTLANIREALHVTSGKNRDRLLFQEQDRVAAAMGYADADALMSGVARAARSVDYLLELCWHRLDHRKPRSGAIARKPRTLTVARNVSLINSEVVIDADISFDEDPVVGLRAAATAAQLGVPLSFDSTLKLASALNSGAGKLTTPWPREARELLISLIGAGGSMVRIFEALDQEEIIFHWLPEWRSVRSLPQRNALHRHTVDRHMVETAVHAAALTRRVSRPDLLLFAALFHDIGKGSDGDHCDRGEELIKPLAQRVGFSGSDVLILQLLVKHHLLLAATATRRDLDDPATIELVLKAIPTRETLELLHALSIADGEATGRAAWSSWKANLVAELVKRVLRVMSGNKRAAQPELDERQLAAAKSGTLAVTLERRDDGYSIEIISPDKPGLLSIVAGVLNLARLDVRSARTKTHGQSAVMNWLVICDPHAPEISAEGLRREIAAAFSGGVNIEAKIAERAKAYSVMPSIPVPPPEVVTFNESATGATIFEIRSHDMPGLLFRISAAITQSKVDIRSAIVTTLGAEAIDTLYVREISGGALTDERAEEVANKLLQTLK